MKTNSWLTVATTFGISLGLVTAQEPQATTAPAPAATPPAPAVTDQTPAANTNTNKPAAKTTKVARKPAPTPPEKVGPPVTVGAATAKQNNINVRGKAAIKSEVLSKLKHGDAVEVLEIVEQKAKADEPDKWARIALPANTPVWIHSDFIDATAKTVKAKRLNVRSGPSEDYSVIGRLEQGTAIKEVERKNDWIRIEPPQGVYGFVAAHLLAPAAATPAVEIAKNETTPPATPTPAATTPPTETTVPPATTTPPPADLAATTPPATTTPASTPPAATPPAEPTTPTTTPAETTPAPEEIKRVVSREGIVKRSVSIQAPTWFVLESPATGKTVNYLNTPSSGMTLRDYFGQRVIVTGEEGLDERWPNTPVINVESIEVVP